MLDVQNGRATNLGVGDFMFVLMTFFFLPSCAPTFLVV